MKKTEYAIGIFVFVGLILLGTMIIAFGNYQYKGRQYVIYAVFNYVSGVVVGAPVRYAGVDCGKVTKADVFEADNGATKVRLTLSIDEKIKIKKDSEGVINSLGIIGEKYVEIFPGTPEAPMIKPQEEIIGIDPVAIESVMAKAQEVLSRLEEALSSVNDVLSSETKQDIKATIVNFKNFGADIDSVTKKAEQIINKINTGEGTFGKLIYAQDLHDELLALIKGIKENGIFYKSKSVAKDVKSGMVVSEPKQKSFGPRK
jgi:phospholipid/cholesterol/gamma-HCH transport system substrate-binding protein